MHERREHAKDLGLSRFEHVPLGSGSTIRLEGEPRRTLLVLSLPAALGAFFLLLVNSMDILSIPDL